MNNEENKVVYLRIDDIIPNRFQPREVFDETGLEELADSIREHGVIQPVIVRQMGDKYELIAGERRTKASALAGLTTIPAIIKNMDDKESAKVSLLENLQRKNLSAIEEARTYKRILELDNMTQEDLAKTMGKSQPLIANKLRLLALPEEVQDALIKNQISERHARSLLNVKDKQEQLILLDRIRNERLTVRDLDNEIKKIREGENTSIPESNSIPNVGFDYNNFNQPSEMPVQDSYQNNFGNMGLDDYRSQVNSNMFNNIPSNYQSFNQQENQFNNLPLDNNMDSTSSVELPIRENNIIQQEQPQTSFINQIDNYSNNNIEPKENNYSSLGSMFDNSYSNNNMIDVSNQEIPTENQNIFISSIKEEQSTSNSNQFIPNFEEKNTSTIGSFNNNFDSSLNNDFNNNSNYNDMRSSYEVTSNYGFNDTQNSEFNDFATPIANNFNQDTNFYGEPVMYNQNQGDLFNQPLDITDVPRELNNDVFNSQSDNNQDEYEDTNTYENLLFAKPVPIQPENSLEENDTYEENNTNKEFETNNQEKEDNYQYISLDPVQTIFDTRGAVLELKKTTDRIKQNNINMETEEIDFDDYYQIIIKIKKEQI